MNEAGPLYTSFIVNCVFNAFSAYIAIMLNILMIHAIRKPLSLSKPLKTLLLSLAVYDLGVGLLVQPLYILMMINPTSSTIIAFTIISLWFGNASFFRVVAISVDRYLAIHLHLRYDELVTPKRVLTAVMFVWFLCVSFPFIFLIARSKELGNVLIITISDFCFIITAVVYCRIYFIVKHHSNQIQVQVQVAQNSQMESAARKRKSAVSTFYVYLVFLVCCLPEYCVTVALLISPPGPL